MFGQCGGVTIPGCDLGWRDCLSLSPFFSNMEKAQLHFSDDKSEYTNTLKKKAKCEESKTVAGDT